MIEQTRPIEGRAVTVLYNIFKEEHSERELFSHSQTVLTLLTKSLQAPDESGNRCSIFSETLVQVQHNALGTCLSPGAHPTELHYYTSPRVLAKKTLFACAKWGRKMVHLAGLGLTQCIGW